MRRTFRSPNKTPIRIETYTPVHKTILEVLSSSCIHRVSISNAMLLADYSINQRTKVWQKHRIPLHSKSICYFFKQAADGLQQSVKEAICYAQNVLSLSL